MKSADAFEDYRPTLFGLAYRMLGSAMDAEDIVQDVYIRYTQAKVEPQQLGAYLRTIATRLCLDQLKSARVQREQYYGEWLPEPLVIDPHSPAEIVGRAEHISLAFLVILEKLSPLERAVFLLREVFDYAYGDIAQMLDRSESACRQLFHRAKKHVQADRPRFDAQPEEHQQIVQTFLAALQNGDLQRLTQLLADDATLYSDGGGKVPAAVRPVYGREKIIALLGGLDRRAQQQGVAYSLEPAWLNGEQGLICRDGATQQVLFAATFEVTHAAITTLYFVRNPDKLGRL